MEEVEIAIESNDEELFIEKDLANANHGPPLQLKFRGKGPNEIKYYGKYQCECKNGRIQKIKTLVSFKTFFATSHKVFWIK